MVLRRDYELTEWHKQNVRRR